MTVKVQKDSIRASERSAEHERKASTGSYVLVTPVKDEVKLFPQTLTSVINQKLRPREWVIVSDGSTDGTDEIIADAASQHPWIRLVRLEPREGRDFAAVVRNTELGIRTLECDDYQFIGLLDADLRFDPDYFERLVSVFEREPELGLAGGVAIDVGTSRDRLPRNREDVPGALQFFRRDCFRSLGGLVAVPEGGWDALTCVMARMNGYRTRLVTDLIVDHLKPRNVGEGGALRRKWQMGLRDYALGYGPLFESVKCVGRLTDRPYFLAATAWFLGYLGALLRRRPRVIDPSVVLHLRREHRARLLAAMGFSKP